MRKMYVDYLDLCIENKIDFFPLSKTIINKKFMKPIIYQIFTRYFGNSGYSKDNMSKPNVPNGTLLENGVGKFSNLTDKVLKSINDFGYTHVWLTGVIDHATSTDYSEIGLPATHPAVVKGKAGSPYAIRDYYNVAPDLADNPSTRLEEFKLLVDRIHKAGLKLIIDFVPNHVARNYHSISAPEGVEDLGAKDRTGWHFYIHNNFYYCVGESFSPQFDRMGYIEYPARATGNDCFTAHPTKNDWYETVKLNYGVDYCGGGVTHFNPHPNTWHKMKDILLYWAGLGVDGFRCDMAEMVPVEFWNWAIRHVKKEYPNLIFIAEIYKPNMYRDFISHGGFDYLYDKVSLYDTLRSVIEHKGPAESLTYAWQAVQDIKKHMLNFLENHDEQRIASTYFAGNPALGDTNIAPYRGYAGMVVAALISQAPLMVYCGQEIGEKGMDSEGFSGFDGRTTIFDYWKVETICEMQSYFNGKKILNNYQQAICDKYRKLLQIAQMPISTDGEMYDLIWLNQRNPQFDLFHTYAFIRHTEKQILLIVVNFSDNGITTGISLSKHLFDTIQTAEVKDIEAVDLFSDTKMTFNFNSRELIHLQIAGNDAVALLFAKTSPE